MANPLLDFVMSLVRDPDAAAQYAADPARAIHAANLTDVTSADVNALIPVVSESLSTAVPTTGAESLDRGSGRQHMDAAGRRPRHSTHSTTTCPSRRSTTGTASRRTSSTNPTIRCMRVLTPLHDAGMFRPWRMSRIRQRSSRAESSTTRRSSATPPTPTGSPSSTTRSTTWTPATPDSTSSTSLTTTSHDGAATDGRAVFVFRGRADLARIVATPNHPLIP